MIDSSSKRLPCRSWFADARTFERPCNYALLRIVPPADVRIDETKRPFLIIDPRHKSITLQTQGLQQEHFNHWIQASFDSAGKVNPKTIVEWVSQ